MPTAARHAIGPGIGTALALGPVAWVVTQQATYWLAYRPCGIVRPTVMLLIDVLGLVATVVGALLCCHPWRLPLAAPVTATFLQAGAPAAWHLPVLFAAALDGRRIHARQHLMLLGTSLLFWRGIGEARRSEERQGLAVICLFLASVLGTLLG